MVFLDDLTAEAGELLVAEDPLEAELYGANLMAAGALFGEEFAEGLSGSIVPALVRSSTAESVAVLFAIDAVADGAGAGEAARRLRETGVAVPGWVDELSAPVTMGFCRRYHDPVGEVSMLLGGFERAGRTHGFIVDVDHDDCDAAVLITLVPGSVLDDAPEIITDEARDTGVTLIAEELDPGEFRRQVERALNARAVHDRGPALSAEVEALDHDDIGSSYPWLAVLLRARIRTLPEPPRPPAAHGSGDGPDIRPR
ncbi:hypothetical protein BJ973_003683 [Actinoplanes tereljensis]|uniref:hypothetical protein n=1 Tax=Paractinoplanes tereljensis TaxID=571912 RepID=UPI001942298A|nr:hypothetical protein [Actinoplanes tereljensis]